MALLGKLSSGGEMASYLAGVKRAEVIQNSEVDRSAVARLMMVLCMELMMTLQEAQAA